MSREKINAIRVFKAMAVIDGISFAAILMCWEYGWNPLNWLPVWITVPYFIALFCSMAFLPMMGAAIEEIE